MIVATNELYNANKGTIVKACWDAYRDNPVISVDDYFSYAEEIFMDATRTYNPSSGAKFNTWLTTQLLRLKKYASRGGAMTSSARPLAESLVLSMDSRRVLENGTTSTLHDMHYRYNDDYASEVGFVKKSSDWFERMSHLKPFVGSLSDDAKTMVNDILDGVVLKKDKDGVPVNERGGKMYIQLSPRQLHLRVYSKRGWKFERVRDARIEIEEMLRKWEPCKLPEPGPEVQVQDELF